jgi:hypothetical protein
MAHFLRCFKHFVCAASAFALVAPSAAGAEQASRPEMPANARGYYRAEMTTAFLFMGFGAATAGGGAVTLTQGGDYARGLGLSSLVLGSLTTLGGAGYALAVKVRGDYYTGLAETNPALYKREEGDRIEGTNSRFALYLGSEIAEALAGIGMTTYGFAAKNELWKGIGVGTAIQGIGLFVIDVPGAGRAARYQEQIRRFNPDIGFSIGGGGRPWVATIGRAF